MQLGQKLMYPGL